MILVKNGAVMDDLEKGKAKELLGESLLTALIAESVSSCKIEIKNINYSRYPKQMYRLT